MDSTKDTASGESSAAQSVTTNANDDPLFALTDLFSGTSLDGRYDEVPMSRPLSALLPTPQLNDHCCLALFNQFTLQEQLQRRAVCRQWQAIIEQKCRRMRSLKIFGNDYVEYYCCELMRLKLQDDDQFKLKPVGSDDDIIGSLDQFRQCAHLFADITTFVCYGYYSGPNLDLIPVMFPQLTSLTLRIRQSPFTVLNSLPLLTSLHLSCSYDNTVIPESMPILRQLECFSLCNYDGRQIHSFLVQLGPNLTRLMLSEVFLTHTQLASVITANPSFATSVTHLTIGCIPTNNPCDEFYGPLLDIICSHMTNLVYLHFYYIYLNWFPSLAKLQHLTELHIDQFVVPDSVPRHLPPVSFVKQLYFTFLYIPTTAFNFWTLFPAVESIAVYEKYDNIDLERARKYMAQFRFTCPVTFHAEKNYKSYMGRHREF